jgi:CubicO group peptidase (beta-lactamase class C family)
MRSRATSRTWPTCRCYCRSATGHRIATPGSRSPVGCSKSSATALIEQAVAALVLAPLGTTRSFFEARDTVYYPTAVGHTTVDGVLRIQYPWQFPRSANPFVGMISWLRDQLRWARFWLGGGTAADGSRLLSPETLTSMTTPQVYNYGYEGTNGYVLAWGSGWAMG